MMNVRCRSFSSNRTTSKDPTTSRQVRPQVMAATALVIATVGTYVIGHRKQEFFAAAEAEGDSTSMAGDVGISTPAPLGSNEADRAVGFGLRLRKVKEFVSSEEWAGRSVTKPTSSAVQNVNASSHSYEVSPVLIIA